MQIDAAALHQPVLCNEVLELLAPLQGLTLVDATVGLGGHSDKLAPRVGEKGMIIGIDRDLDAITLAKKRLCGVSCKTVFYNCRFSQIQSVVEDAGLERVDRILLDLGVSSMQLDSPERGFSFRSSGPLDMRMSRQDSQDAAEIIARSPERELADLIYKYGEERFSRRIAKSLVATRRYKPIKTTEELAALVRSCIPGRSAIDKATRTFQALRIAVNDELGELEKSLKIMLALLAPKGRMAVISFHSLEDRIVKHEFRAASREQGFKLLTKKPVIAQAEERKLNSRSRSAKLRVIAGNGE